MRKTLFALLLCWSSLAAAGVINIEFQFTPFVGDPATAKEVETVPGKASVYVNNVPVAEQEVRRGKVPVLFEEHEIGPAVWLPVQSLGPVLRKGKNKVRIEFEPANATAPYRAQLRWASVTDQVARTEEGPGRVRETNQSDEGVDERKVSGKVVFEREFVADFATDLPWHHYPPVTALSDEDKKALVALVKERADKFKPDFSGAYQLLKEAQGVNLAEIKKAKCLDKAYAVGVRVAAQASDKIDFVLTGNPEVVIRGKEGALYRPLDLKAFDRIKGDEMQMCAGMALAMLYPPHLVVVRDPSGTWHPL